MIISLWRHKKKRKSDTINKSMLSLRRMWLATISSVEQSGEQSLPVRASFDGWNGRLSGTYNNLWAEIQQQSYASHTDCCRSSVGGCAYFAAYTKCPVCLSRIYWWPYNCKRQSILNGSLRCVASTWWCRGLQFAAAKSPHPYRDRLKHH